MRHMQRKFPCDGPTTNPCVCGKSYSREDSLKAHQKRCFMLHPLETTECSLEQAHELAARMEGECLSTEYTSSKIKMEWRCKEGHEWKATLHQIKALRAWCDECARPKLTLEKAQAVAAERKGICLSTGVGRTTDPLEWKCREGHTFTLSYSDVAHGPGQWCPECTLVRTLTIEDAKAAAIELGGECLSLEYKSCRVPLHWRCGKGHEWHTPFTNIRHNGTWCPDCSTMFMGEGVARGVFEEFFGVPFVKERPKFLEGLEMDGWNKRLGIAFERNGAQHEKYVPFFHRNGIQDYLDLKERDTRKERLCKEHGIKLIIIPSYVKNFKAFILNKLKEMGYADQDGVKVSPFAILMLTIDYLVTQALLKHPVQF